VATLWLLSSASTIEASKSSIPKRAIKVAGSQKGSSSWGIWLFGANDQGCWGTRTRSHGQLTGETVTCGFSVPGNRFQLAATGSLEGGQSLLFFLVRSPEVERLRVLIDRGTRSTRWVAMDAHPVNSARHPAARVPAGVGTAVKLVAGRACPRRVVALNKRDQPIGHGSLPPCAEQ
jgi:hypothetical protein